MSKQIVYILFRSFKSGWRTEMIQTIGFYHNYPNVIKAKDKLWKEMMENESVSWLRRVLDISVDVYYEAHYVHDMPEVLEPMTTMLVTELHDLLEMVLLNYDHQAELPITYSKSQVSNLIVASQRWLEEMRKNREALTDLGLNAYLDRGQFPKEDKHD